MKKSAIVLLAALLALLGTPASGRAATVSKNAAANAHLSDSEIEQNIRAKLAKSKIGKDGFTVKVKGGVVTWEGFTNVIQHKGAATRMARTAGARQVINNIKISDSARQKAAGNLEGGARRVQVKTN